ncbi:uncharacterized protein Z518_06898 [Rhinocladiella mackenziei CBS 650.93]|uniref:XPG-I domain-containing protein n=1 Tax=Rhinocladiella mackenziei CBS 650.93 TaxID=1442369 RepID=A0A0D2IJB0_9EURO|nr:uncharacterized protein Z518_06898 [Rhinocladiella mackenziei CBS 650.93]KIX03346.1 hypothetical protein Z518_06898 [Rhinocladiella mackenziei CBS 650.93]
MGIPGILKEIGKGERVALAKLAVDHLEQSQRPLRIAVDAAIWNFQTQASQGGKNPALRTLFYRLLKLLALPIHPVFVYDGQNKPLTKRGKTVSGYGTCISNERSKKLIQAFRFPHHTAPGEAEAECAMLQSKGIVDAVMSQDVDAIMFGSTRTLRDWSKETSKHSKSPTHVNVLDIDQLQSLSRLDPDGMILVALLGGGDYDEVGVAGIGSTLACEIARAGFGSELLGCVRRGDEVGVREWRERLQFELQTNESGYFKIKRKSVQIPDTFPNRQILGYYMNPAVTPEDQLAELEGQWLEAWKSEIDIPALRDYVGETFEWLYKPGAWKFVRVMAPALLANRLHRGTARSDIQSADQITERRKHFVSDGIPELRVTAVPAEVVGLNLDAEGDSPAYLKSLAADEESGNNPEAGNADEDGPVPQSPSKKRKTPPWLPDAPEKMWIPEAIVEMGAQEYVDRWRQIQEELKNDPKKFATRKCRKQKETKQHKDTGGTQVGTRLNYVVPSSDVAALPDMTSAPSPHRPRANIGAHRVPRIPTKLGSSQLKNASSSSLQDYFKPSKSRYFPDATQRMSGLSKDSSPSRRTNAAGGEKENMDILLHETAAEKHSRSPTSSSSEGIRQVMKRSTRTRTKGRPHIQLSSEKPTWSLKADSNSAYALASNQNTSPEEILLKESIVITSSPIQRGIESTKRHLDIGDTTADGLQNIKGTVTPHRSGKAGKKDHVSAKAASTTGDPDQTKPPIESFSAPYIAANQQKTSSAEVQSVVIPPDLTTGLTTTFSATHVRAIPRSSLPGTWKEAECTSVPSSPLEPSERSRGPRVSVVDLIGN